jgi:polyphosphate glucokinase
MVAGVLKAAAGWRYEAASIGYRGAVLHGRPVSEPHKLINDAAMQALGSYAGGKKPFLGLGTGLGSAMIVDGIVEPMELGHLP